MAATYEPIATTTFSSTSIDYTFSSIPATYTDLVLVASQNQSGTSDYGIRFNGDSGGNYSRTVLYGNGSAAGSTRGSTTATRISCSYYGYPPSAASTFGVGIISIMNYANTTTYKTLLARSNSAGSGLDANVGTWRNTAAITSVTILLDAGTFSVGSTFTLYGIKAA